MSDCLKFVSEIKEVPSERLALCLAKSDEVRRILLPDSTTLMSEVLDELNGPKYVNCRFVCFELRASLEPGTDSLKDLVPVVFKYEKILKSINTFINHPVKTGSISLLLVSRREADRDIYNQLLYLFNDLLSEKELGLLSQNFKDNLLPSENKDSQPSKTAEKNIGLNVAADKSGKSSQSTKEATKASAKSNQKLVTPQGKPGSTSKSVLEAKPSSNQISKLSKDGGNSPEEGIEEKINDPEEEFTFRDLLNEVVLGFVEAKAAATSPLLAEKDDYRKTLEDLASQKQSVSLRYDNPHKLKCHNCGRPGYHTCKIASGNTSRVDALFKTLRDGKVNESPSCSVTFSVLVNDQATLDLLDKRSISEDGARGLQLKSHIDLNYCLDTMQKKEDMGKDSLVDCSKCDKKTEREVCYLIEHAPKLFLMQLKRFKTDYNVKTQNIEKRKVCTMVELHESVQVKDQTFDLYGVVNHYGEIDKGHYTACVKRPEDGQWFLYDDEKVSQVAFKDVNSEGAYLLFFKLQSAQS